jgi:predicted nucleic acid-binding protein
MRQHPPAVEFLIALGARPRCSEVSRVELLQGLRSHQRSAARRLTDWIDWTPVSQAVAERAGELGRTYRASHGLDVADLCIAATALVDGLPLATSNVKHFPMFAGLAPAYER